MAGWEGIDEFVAVATAGSFRAGAQALGASTTHMSRAIARLEMRVQTQLFHRTTRVVHLTDAGRIFLEHCRRIVMERDEAIALINEGGEPQGELRVTCSTAMGERFVAPLIHEFTRQHRKLAVNLHLTNRLVDIVGEGFDLAIRTGHLADSRLIATRVASRTLLTCASPEYLREKGYPRQVGDLKAHACLIGTMPNWHFKSGKAAEMFRPKGRIRCNSGTAVVQAAISGLGICQLPEFYVIPYLSSGRLELVLNEFAPDAEPIWAVYPQRRHLLPKVSHFVSLLKDRLASELAGQRPLAAQ